VLTFPDADATWVFDFTEKVWHERAYWDGTTLHRQHQAFHGYAWNKHITGDYASGQLYWMSHSFTSDAGNAIFRQRACPYVSNATLKTYFHRFTLDQEKNTGGAGNMTLDWSDDGGVTWVNATTAAYDDRVMWRRLGSARRRSFRVTYSGPGFIAWINAHIEISEGST
jgi:hypothetical protein